MKEIYFTLTGCCYYLGTEFMKPGMTVKLKKDTKNEYDQEAIMVKMKGIGKVGYVANSPKTVIGDCMSAGRIYDKFGKKAKGEIVAVTDCGVICRMLPKEVVVYEQKEEEEQESYLEKR